MTGQKIYALCSALCLLGSLVFFTRLMSGWEAPHPLQIARLILFLGLLTGVVLLARSTAPKK